MADESLLDKVHDLSDLELAILLCLISREHCLLSTPASAIEGLVQELQLISAKTFGLHSTIIKCSSCTTLEDFASSLLLPSLASQTPAAHDSNRSGSYFVSKPAGPGSFSARPSGGRGVITSFGSSTPSFQIANFVIAKDIDQAPTSVQIQALELLRTRRIFTRTSVQTAPKQFVFVPVLSAERGGTARVTKHLNDFFFVGHWHDPEDGFVNLEEEELGEHMNDGANGLSDLASSTVKKVEGRPLISETDISHLAKLSRQVQIDVDITRYQMNIVSHLRLHRAVESGISPTATKHYGQLIRCLAPLHKLDFVNPALVGLAARKIYLHRITIIAPSRERSLQWGSNLEAIKTLLDGVGPEEVIEDVLGMVTSPL